MIMNQISVWFTQRMTTVLLLTPLFFLPPTTIACSGMQKNFIIGSWVGPRQTEAQYRLYKDSGFNTLLDYPWEGDNYATTLRLAEKVGGLSVILNIDQMFMRYKPEPFVPYARIEKFIKETQKSKVVLGYTLFDEPYDKDVNLLVETGKYIRTLEPDKLTWIDFFPNSADRLTRSVVKAKPSVIGFNYYPFKVKGHVLEGYYQRLEYFRSLALESGTPLWLFVQSVAQVWPPDRKEDMRMPTPSEMRLQVYVNLAYGAKGLWYYTYAIPRQFKAITAAILDGTDKPTPVYYSVKQLNREVLALGPLLMRLASVDVMHVNPKQQGVKPFVANDVIAGINGDNLLVGVFKDERGGSFFMLVNKLTSGVNSLKVKLHSKITALYQVDRVSGRLEKYPLKNGYAVVDLEPGNGMLFKGE